MHLFLHENYAKYCTVKIILYIFLGYNIRITVLGTEQHSPLEEYCSFACYIKPCFLTTFHAILDILLLSSFKQWIQAHVFLNKPIFLSLIDLLYEEIPLYILVESLMASHLHCIIYALLALKFLFYHL